MNHISYLSYFYWKRVEVLWPWFLLHFQYINQLCHICIYVHRSASRVSAFISIFMATTGITWVQMIGITRTSGIKWTQLIYCPKGVCTQLGHVNSSVLETSSSELGSVKPFPELPSGPLCPTFNNSVIARQNVLLPWESRISLSLREAPIATCCAGMNGWIRLGALPPRR